MKTFVAAFIMCAVVGAGATSSRRTAPVEVAANSSTLSYAEDTSSVTPMGGCSGSPPCCDFNDDGTCNLHMFCFGGLWTCP
jgi:hypothetical protein